MSTFLAVAGGFVAGVLSFLAFLGWVLKDFRIWKL